MLSSNDYVNLSAMLVREARALSVYDPKRAEHLKAARLALALSRNDRQEAEKALGLDKPSMSQPSNTSQD